MRDVEAAAFALFWYWRSKPRVPEAEARASWEKMGDLREAWIACALEALDAGEIE